MQLFYRLHLFTKASQELGIIKDGRIGPVWHEITLSAESDEFKKIMECDRMLRKESDFAQGLVAMAEPFRKYSQLEIENAELFHLRIPPDKLSPIVSDDSAYDASSACGRCGAGRKQITPLRLNVRKLPQNSPVVCTLANEWLVNAEFAEILRSQRLRGFSLCEIENSNEAPTGEPEAFPSIADLQGTASGRELIKKARLRAGDTPARSYNPMLQFVDVELWHKAIVELRKRKEKSERGSAPQWFQIKAISKGLFVCPPTRFGSGNLDEDTESLYKCQRGDVGHVRGLNIFSEVFACRSGWDESDFNATLNWFGEVHNPTQLIMVSPRLRQFLTERGSNDLVFDIAHFV